MLPILACLASLNPITICIDPGHVSEVGAGTRGRKTTELKVVWEVAVKLQDRLTAQGYRVVMTKKSLEERVTNTQRAQIANTSKASLFLRLHCDAVGGSGFAVYYPDRQGKAKDGSVGPSASVLSASKPIAQSLHRSLAQGLKGSLADRGLFTDRATLIGGKQGALTGSIFSKVPVVLVEMAVLTNPKDEEFIAGTAGQKLFVSSLEAGIDAALKRRS